MNAKRVKTSQSAAAAVNSEETALGGGVPSLKILCSQFVAQGVAGALEEDESLMADIAAGYNIPGNVFSAEVVPRFPLTLLLRMKRAFSGQEDPAGVYRAAVREIRARLTATSDVQNGVEKEWRAAYVKPESAAALDPHIGLMDVFACHDFFRLDDDVFRTPPDDATREHFIVPMSSLEGDTWTLRASKIGGCLVASRYVFFRQFSALTSNMFENFCWDNVVVAGGAVETAATPLVHNYSPSSISEYASTSSEEEEEEEEAEQGEDNELRVSSAAAAAAAGWNVVQSDYGVVADGDATLLASKAALCSVYSGRPIGHRYERVVFGTSAAPFGGNDVDIFLYGLTPREATRRLDAILCHFIENAPSPGCFIVQTTHAVTVYFQYPVRRVQIVLRAYTSPAEILHGFDIDACTVAFDGRRVWCTERFYRAAVTRTNYVDTSRASPTYETRLLKYWRRGYHIAAAQHRRSELLSVPEIALRFYSTAIAGSKKDARISPLVRILFEVYRAHNGDHHGSTSEEIKYLLQLHYDNARFRRGRTGASDYDSPVLRWGSSVTLNGAYYALLAHLRRSASASNRTVVYGDFHQPPPHAHLQRTAATAPVSRVLYRADIPSPLVYFRCNRAFFSEDAAGRRDEELVATSVDYTVKKRRVRWLVENPSRQFCGSIHPTPQTFAEWSAGVYRAGAQ